MDTDFFRGPSIQIALKVSRTQWNSGCFVKNAFKQLDLTASCAAGTCSDSCAQCFR